MRTLLQINVVVNWGSTGHIAEDIGQMVLSKGWKSYIAYGRNERPSQSQLIRVGTTRDMLWHGLQTRLLDRQGLASVRATRELLKQMDAIRPDIVHLHVIHGYYLNYPLLFRYLQQHRISVVWTMHDCWSFTGHCAHYTAKKCNRWQTGCRHCPQLGAYPKSWWADRSMKNWQEKKSAFASLERLTLVPVSNWLADELRQSFLGDKPIVCIHNGVDANVFSIKDSDVKQRLGIAEKKMLLGVASVWNKRKGLDDFCRLSEVLPSEYALVLVGLSEKQIERLPKSVIGLSRTENVQQLVELYSAADVFLNPTWEDTFPTTNLEALACGTPVITYRTGGSVEVITPNTGYVVEPGDMNGLLEKIKLVSQRGKDVYRSLCRQYILDNFKKEDRYEEYFRLYERILSEK